MSKITGESMNITEENIKKLQELFPDIVCDGKVDFDKLKQNLGEFVDDDTERYNFTWNGKGRALRLSQTPSMGTLRPCKEESVDWDNTKNLYIEGDNLEVLKLLQKSYHSKIKLIYIDPPYNTGHDFVYPDNFTDSIEHYKRITGQLDEDGKAVSTNSDTSGRYHTDWLNMMYPRLRLARRLLKDNGAIFISIDDNEVDNLKKLCNEVFGEDNFIAQFNWKRKKEISSDSKNVAIQGEYLLCYGKSNMTTLKFEALSEDYVQKSYNPPNDEYPNGMWRPVPLTVSKGLSGGGYTYTITTPGGTEHTRLWAYPQKSYLELVENGRVYFGKDKCGVPQRVIYAHESKGQPVSNYWEDVATNKEGKKEILNIFGDNYFDTPKPVGLIKKICNLMLDEKDIVLDFFSGSGTVAQALMEFNEENEATNKFILVQIPEVLGDDNIAKKAGFSTLCEVGKERIRRAASVIDTDVDKGFKVFKLDNSNLKKWQPKEDLETSIMDFIENFIEDGRTELDVVYEIMLKMGLDLNYPIETIRMENGDFYSVGYGALMICLADKISEEVAKQMVALHDELQPAIWKVVFKDNGFSSDSSKTNIKEILKCAGLAEEAFTTI